MKNPAARSIKKTVVILNSVLVCRLLALAYRNFLDESHIRGLLGKPPVGLGSYMLEHVRVLLFPLVLLAGIALEVSKSKFAWLINIGPPLLALILLLIGIARTWQAQPGEGEIGLFLFVLPLSIVCLVYAALYRRDTTLAR